MRRTMFGSSGLFYLALALTSADIAIGASRVSENRSIREWTGWRFCNRSAAPLSPSSAWLCCCRYRLVVQALRATIGIERCLANGVDGRSRAWIVWYLTRAAIFLMFACSWFCCHHLNAREAIGLTGALRTMQNQSYGAWQLGFAALGLLAFGLFEIIEAFARKIYTPKPAAKSCNQSEESAGHWHVPGQRSPGSATAQQQRHSSRCHGRSSGP